MDNFAEQLVFKHPTSSDKAKKIFLIVGGGIMTAILLLIAVLSLGSGSLLSLAGILLAAATGFGSYYLVSETYVEYEYTFTNGELDIDKIIAKKKRVELVTVDVKKLKAFGKYGEASEETEDMTVIFSSDNIASHEYYADFDHEEYGSSRLVFSPDSRMLDMLATALPRALRQNK